MSHSKEIEEAARYLCRMDGRDPDADRMEAVEDGIPSLAVLPPGGRAQWYNYAFKVKRVLEICGATTTP